MNMAFTIKNISLLSNFSSNICKLGQRQLASATGSRTEARLRRVELFEQQQSQQRSLVPRMYKINVEYHGKPQPYTFRMNKLISTPHHCAMHMKEHLVQQSVVARVDGELWDLHRPLEGDCQLELLNFHCSHCPDLLPLVNQVFWRSCAFLLGKVADKAFKDDFPLQLKEFSDAPVESGSFVYDVITKDHSWTPSKGDLQSLNHLLRKEVLVKQKFERLSVPVSLARTIFANNPMKLAELEQKGDSEDVTVYRVGDHVDLIPGPLMSNTGLVGIIHLTAVHPVETPQGFCYRFQGLALPSQLKVPQFSYKVLLNRATKLNPTGLDRTAQEKVAADTTA